MGSLFMSIILFVAIFSISLQLFPLFLLSLSLSRCFHMFDVYCLESSRMSQQATHKCLKQMIRVYLWVCTELPTSLDFYEVYR